METTMNHRPNENFEDNGNRNYRDYSLSCFLEKKGYANPEVSIRNVTLKSGEIVPLLHIRAVNIDKSSEYYGVVFEYDIWPRQHATYEDLQKFPETFVDATFRLSWTEVNGQIVDSNPKWTDLILGEKKYFKLSGPKREFEDDYEQKPASKDEDEE